MVNSYGVFKPNSLIATSIAGFNGPNRHLIKSYHSDRMFVTSDFNRSKWYHSDQLVKEKELCYLKFAHLVDQPLVSNLKHLALCDESPEFDLNKLNQFDQLTHLEIDRCLGEQPVNLHLPELRVLAIHRFNEHCRLSIDCPELEVLLYRGEPEDENLLDVKHPETIRKLETDMVGAKLDQFENVKCLVTKTLFSIHQNTLQSLPNLKELRCNASIMGLERELRKYRQHYRTGYCEEIQLLLRQFLDALEKLRRSDLQFIVSGFQMDIEKLEDDIEFWWPKKLGLMRFSEEYFFIRNHNLIDEPMDFIKKLNYTLLMENQAGMARKSFYRKFTGVKEVHSGPWTVEYPSHFLSLLKSLGSLIILDLRQSGLGPDFYEQLPTAVPQLVQLVLQECPEECGVFNGWKMEDEYPGIEKCKKLDCMLEMNFDFIDQLPHLSRVYVHQNLTLLSMCSLLRWADRLEEIEFCFSVKAERFLVKKTAGSEEFEVFKTSLINEQRRLKTKNPVEVVEFFESLQNASEDSSVKKIEKI